MHYCVFLRCARKKDPDHEPIMAWVDAADMMYQTGLEQYSESVFLHIAYANFLSTYKKSAMVRNVKSCYLLLARWLTKLQLNSIAIGHV